MNAPHPLRSADALAVTSSDLVRHFGLWQDRAQQAPVYIHHRGRPRLVLASVELMSRLCAPHAEPAGTGRERLAAILDAIDLLAVLVDRDGLIAAIGRRTARFFGADVGAPAASLAAGGTAPLLEAAIARVLGSGQDETLDIVGPHRGRRIAIELAGGADGLVLVARDATVADELADARAAEEATVEALAAAGGAAVATIGLRGYLEGSAPLLATLTGVAAEALASVRFVTLFDPASRVPLGEAIEAVVAESQHRGVSARLSINRGAPCEVDVGLAPVRRRGATVAVRAAIVGTMGASDEPSDANRA